MSHIKQVEKILFIIDSFQSPYAGTEGQLFKLVRGLDRSRFEPHLIVFNRSEFIDQNGFPCDVSTLEHSKLSSIKTWWKLFTLLKRKRGEGFGLAHVFFNDPSIIAPPLLKVLGIKSIISRRDMGYWYTPAYLKILRLNSKLVDVALVNSEAVKKVTCEKESYDPQNVRVIYNGYSELEIDPSRKMDFCSQQDQTVCGIVANIRPIKRMQDAIHAISGLTKRGHDVRLVIVGGGDCSELESLAMTLGIDERVTFTGSQSCSSDFIQGFDICLLCSESEGFSNAIIEYMQHGKPVVCSAVGGNPESVVEGQTGYLYPTADVGQLMSCLSKLVEDKSIRHAFGARAARRVQRYYGMDVMLNAHEQLYRELLSDR